MRQQRILKGVIIGLVGLALLSAAAPSVYPFVSPLQDRPAPELANTTWINSAPLRLEELRGKVILLEFWTYG